MSVFVFHEVYIHVLACNPIIVYSVEVVFKNLCSKLFRNITPTTMLTQYGTTQTDHFSTYLNAYLPLYPTITRSKRPFFWFAKHEKRNHNKEFSVHLLLKLMLRKPSNSLSHTQMSIE